MISHLNYYKKAFQLFLIVFLTLSANTVKAQIPNASFESWTGTVPDNWLSVVRPSSFSLSYYSSNVTGLFSMSNISHSGNNAIRLNVVDSFGKKLEPLIISNNNQWSPVTSVANSKVKMSWWTKYNNGYTATVYWKLKDGSGHAFRYDFSTGINSTLYQYNAYVFPDSTEAIAIAFASPAFIGSPPLVVGDSIVIDDIQITNVVTGVNEIQEKGIVFIESVMPNPAQNDVTIVFNMPNNIDNVQLSLFDINGKLVKQLGYYEKLDKGRYKEAYDLSDISNGIYAIQLKTNTTISSKKLIIQK